MAESVTDRLREEILTSRLAPGERLVELQLASRLGESRATIRMALIELGKEGLVVRESNRGATVRRVSLAEAIQIAEARAVLEGLVAANAARRATGNDRKELRQLIKAMHRAVNSGELMEYSNLNAKFHRTLQNVSQHAIANDLVRNLRDRGASHQYRLALVPGRAEQSLKEHGRIADAVITGDDAMADEAMRAHLGSVVAALRRWAEVDGRS
jgi:DNA-binding GntR family transcriptional regulator